MNRPDTHTVVWLLGLAIVIGLSQPASALRKNQPWGVTTRADPDTPPTASATTPRRSPIRTARPYWAWSGLHWVHCPIQ